MMFCVVYSFEVKDDAHEQFIKAWQELTELIFNHEGSLGSRLHKVDDSNYIAYAQWPDRKTWENSGSKLPASAESVREAMRDACLEIKTLHQMEVVNDRLKRAE